MPENSSIRYAEFGYLLLSVALTVAGQMVAKWQMGTTGPMPGSWAERIEFFGALLARPWVLFYLACAFLAALAWMAALIKIPLSLAYPFGSLSLVATLFLSAIFFAESLTIQKIVGAAFIVTGVYISSRG